MFDFLNVPWEVTRDNLETEKEHKLNKGNCKDMLLRKETMKISKQVSVLFDSKGQKEWEESVDISHRMTVPSFTVAFQQWYLKYAAFDSAVLNNHQNE